jgi:chlorite dismutase
MSRMFTVFRGGKSGAWRVTRSAPVKGAALAPTPALSVVHSLTIALPILPSLTSWRLAGVASHLRYTERSEKNELDATPAEIGRPEATCAALIPIKKSAAWWDLTQEERREIFEDKSHHIASSLKYLPDIARKLYHSRDLGQPFDFLTWFEYAPAHADAFEELVAALRASEEWKFVEREVDIRMERERLDAGD